MIQTVLAPAGLRLTLHADEMLVQFRVYTRRCPHCDQDPRTTWTVFVGSGISGEGITFWQALHRALEDAARTQVLYEGQPPLLATRGD